MSSIVTEARERGITRLCHITKSVNLPHILTTRQLSGTDELERSAEGYRPNDENRWDGHRAHVHCSLEYPNGWYLDSARERDPNFRDWIVLVLDVELLGVPGVRFCPHNASRAGGARIADGIDAFRSLFGAEVRGRGDYVRGADHPEWWPTDDQAEVLLPAPVPIERVRRVVFRDECQAELEVFRLQENGKLREAPEFVVAPALFDKRELSGRLRSGRRPPEWPLAGNGN